MDSSMVYAATFRISVQAGIHVNYQETVLRMKDGLPKMKDIAQRDGGSGVWHYRYTSSQAGRCHHLLGGRFPGVIILLRQATLSLAWQASGNTCRVPDVPSLVFWSVRQVRSRSRHQQRQGP